MSQPIYSIGIGSIKSINPYTHVYRLQDLMQVKQKTGDVTCINAIPLGARGNTLMGVQSQHSYQIGDRVLYVKQTAGSSVTTLGFILGVLTTELIDSTPVAGTMWDGGNLQAKNFPKFDQWAQTSGATRVPTNVGHSGIDMLPSAYELTGRLVAFQFSDYYAALRATCAELLVNGMERRIVLQSMLRTDSTVNSLADISILNESTIDTHKWCGNVKDAWYNCLNEDDTQIVVKTGKSPKYRIVEQSGDILYGKHTTLLDEGGTTPLYTDYLGLDGTRKILSSSRLVLGKYPGVIATEYIGDRLSVEEHTGEEPTPENIRDALQNLNVSSDNWAVYADIGFVEHGGYPEEFLDAAQAEYSNYFEPIELKDSLRRDKKIKITPGNSYIEFQDDGGIKLIDAWGSFILLSHGNIELHAINNLFGVSGRDTLMFAGANRTDFAKNNIAVEAYTGKLQMISDDNLELRSKSNLNLEVDGTLHINAFSSAEFNCPIISVRCQDARYPLNATPGRFQLLAPNGTIDISAPKGYLRQQASQVSITSDINALVVGVTGVTTTGLLDVRGGIQSTSAPVTLTIPGEVRPHKFYAGSDMRWINMAAGLGISGDITTTGTLSVAGGIHCHDFGVVQQWEGNEKPPSVNNRMLQLTTKLTATTPTVTKGSTAGILTLDDFDDYAFKFDPTNVNTLYRVVNALPTKNASNVFYEGYSNYKNNVSYIYPGQIFWEKSGALNVVTNKPLGFAKVPTANI